MRRYNHARMSPEFRRKNIRLGADAYLGRRLYFVTLCFHQRQRFGSNPRIASWLIKKLQSHSVKAGFLIHAYCIMPDHAHVLALGANGESNLRSFIENFKQDTGFLFKTKRHAQLWQFKYYDHIVRSEESAERIAVYIWTNPVRKGLCRTIQEYPLSGALSDFGISAFRDPTAQPWTPPWKLQSSRALSRGERAALDA